MIDLDAFDNDAFNLIMFALIGPPDLKFKLRDGDFSCLQSKFRSFSVVLLWSYFILPSNDFSYISGFMTIDPELAQTDDMKSMLEKLMSGIAADEAAQLYRALRDELREEALLTAARWVPEMFRKSSDQIFKLARLRYFRTGIYNNKVLKAVHKKYPKGV